MASPLAGKPILVAEDEVVSALDLAVTFADAGAIVVAACNCADARGLLEDWAWASAVLEYSFSDTSCDFICEWMIKRDIPLILYTGYTIGDEIAHKDTVVMKPASSDEVVRVMAELVSCKPRPALGG
jgi:hypothetical protein